MRKFGSLLCHFFRQIATVNVPDCAVIQKGLIVVAFTIFVSAPVASASCSGTISNVEASFGPVNGLPNLIATLEHWEIATRGQANHAQIEQNLNELRACAGVSTPQAQQPRAQATPSPDNDAADAEAKAFEQQQKQAAKQTKAIAEQSSDDVLSGFTSAKTKPSVKSDDPIEKKIAAMSADDVSNKWIAEGCDENPKQRVCDLLYKRKNVAIDEEAKTLGLTVSQSKNDDILKQMYADRDCSGKPDDVTCKAIKSMRQSEAASPGSSTVSSKKVGQGNGSGGQCEDIDPQTNRPCVTLTGGPTGSDDGFFRYLNLHNSCQRSYSVSSTDDSGNKLGVGVGAGSTARITCGNVNRACGGFTEWHVQCSQ